jgi:nucleotide-binding universal stress UspA family protein
MRLLEVRTILVASDLTDVSHAAVQTAVDLSRASGAALHVVHVAPDTDDSVDDEDRRTRQLGRLDAELHGVGATEGEFECHLVSGEPAASIADQAHRIHADVVILGRGPTKASASHDRSLAGTAHAVMSQSHALCLAIAEPLTLPITNAVVAIDRSESARAALLVALSWISLLRATTPGEEQPTLTTLYVDSGADSSLSPGSVEPKTIEHELSVLRRNAGPWAGVTVLTETVEANDPAAAIAQYARDHGSELVVLGTRRPEHREVGLGSVSETLARRLATPLLLVPPGVWRNHTKDVDYF